jgi:hypothetical protein
MLHRAGLTDLLHEETQAAPDGAGADEFVHGRVACEGWVWKRGMNGVRLQLSHWGLGSRVWGCVQV